MKARVLLIFALFVFFAPLASVAARASLDTRLAGVAPGQPIPPAAAPALEVAGALQRAPGAPTACSTPVTQSLRGKTVDLDQCYQRTFSHGGTNWTINVYYTEQDTSANLGRCTVPPDYDGRCEHKLSNVDDGGGNNVNAVAMGAEAETAMRFYKDRGLPFLWGGDTTLTIYIAEDPRGGGIPTCSSILVDDEWVDSNDTLSKRVLAFHEMQHLIQCHYQPTPGWDDFYGEGIARAIEDRADNGLDADIGHLFIPEIQGLLSEDGTRSTDLKLINYRSALWWTWLLDQYRSGGETQPVTGWLALKDFYTTLSGKPDTLTGLRNFITSKLGTFRQDFTDYTLALFAYRFTSSPSFARLDFLDSEINTYGGGLSGHTVYTLGPIFVTTGVGMDPRSSQYWEFTPAGQCSFIGFTFNGGSKPYSFSVMTVDNSNNLAKRWTSYSKTWARTVRTSGLSRVVGVVTAIDDAGNVDVGRGCVNPTLQIKSPTTASFAMVGTSDAPRNFIVRVKVTGSGGGAVAGLAASDFQVQMQKKVNISDPPAPWINASILSSAYVMDDYWLLVRAPNTAQGGETGRFYHLQVNLGSANDKENSSVLYIENTQDVMVVLDRSGSMGPPTGKIEAARNAAALLINELADSDRGGYVAFDTAAVLRNTLETAGSGPGSHRQTVINTIAGETPGGWTSIGGGMETARAEYHPKKDPERKCSFVLLSDGYENSAPMWNDVKAAVIAEGCPIHAIALGPEANEALMQQISAAVPGGSYDYADQSGSVPLRPASGPSAPSASLISWQNNLSRVYDYKAAQIAGRQRIQTFETVGDKDQVKEYHFYVDEATDKVVLAIAWQAPAAGYTIELFDPFGDPAIPTAAPLAPSASYGSLVRRISPQETNEVWELGQPVQGFWTLKISNLLRDYLLSATTESFYQLHLFIGAPLETPYIGSIVPIQAMFVGPDKPITGADVNANVRDPGGASHALHLFDDGNHGDGEAGDGVYGNFYSATAFGDGSVAGPPDENQAPQVIGSYLVNAVAIKGDIRREAQGSFALDPAEDANGNDIPDTWEKQYGLVDPRADDDPDGDRLTNYCEYRSGTDPLNSDTDGGGQSDGSEAPACIADPATQDPLDPADDRVGRIGSLNLRRILNPRLLLPAIQLWWGAPSAGSLVNVDIYRQETTPALALAGAPQASDWVQIGADVQGNQFEDNDVQQGVAYRYRIVPSIAYDAGAPGGAPAAIADGTAEESEWAAPSSDPYPPSGSILIDGGAPVTWDPLVTLDFTADDSSGGSDGAPDPFPGDPVGDLQMRVSNSPDFSGAAWMPFTTQIAGWDLGSPAPGSTVAVYVQFKDTAGNISTSGFGLADTIQFQPLVYLPLVRR